MVVGTLFICFVSHSQRFSHKTTIIAAFRRYHPFVFASVFVWGMIHVCLDVSGRMQTRPIATRRMQGAGGGKKRRGRRKGRRAYCENKSLDVYNSRNVAHRIGWVAGLAYNFAQKNSLGRVHKRLLNQAKNFRETRRQLYLRTCPSSQYSTSTKEKNQKLDETTTVYFLVPGIRGGP